MMPNRHSIRTARSIAAVAACLCACCWTCAAAYQHLTYAYPDERVHVSTDRLRETVRSMARDDTIAVWIFFEGDRHTDYQECDRLERSGAVSSRAVRRIRRRAGGNSLCGYRAVRKEYIDGAREHVLRIRSTARYFNAISADVLVDAVDALSSLPYVVRVDRVAVFRRGGRPAPHPERPTQGRRSIDDPLFGFYGESCAPLRQIQAYELLEMGYNGSGVTTGGMHVLICLLDTGYDLAHEALEHVRVVAEYDFVQYDSVTSDEEGDLPGQERHGTAVLGAIAGYHEGDLIGPAWGAGYLLAKTEIEGEETKIEEDKWVAAVFWADSAGADIVSSSLGYIDWYDPAVDIDGNTALCTRAADIAVSHGIVVVNSAGNRGTSGIIPPADGDSVITVGAVYSNGDIVGFSSRGPTADGRIKPDVVALGSRVYSVDHTGGDAYASYSGTSMAAPLVAGLCALMLEIHPEWGPIDVRHALLATATRSDEPDNTYGYGIPQGVDAAGISKPNTSNRPIITMGYPNPFRNEVKFDLFFPVLEPVTARIFDCRGMLVRTLAEDRILQCRWSLNWDGTDDAGRTVAAGMYFLDVSSLRTRRTAKVLYLPQ